MNTLVFGLGGTGVEVVNRVKLEMVRRMGKDSPDGIGFGVIDWSKAGTGFGNDNGGNSSGMAEVWLNDGGTLNTLIPMYRDKGIAEWFGGGFSLHGEIMNGEYFGRVGVRLGFMHAMETDILRPIEELLHDSHIRSQRDPMRIIIVSSLAGATGSGLAVLFALWLRRYIITHRCNAYVEGLFVMPDVYLNNCKSLNNKKSADRLRSNTYAAIREIETIRCHTVGEADEETPHIRIHGLYDSETDDAVGKALYHNISLYDAVGSDGQVMDGVSGYMANIAEAVYNQLFEDFYSRYNSQSNFCIAHDIRPGMSYTAIGSAKAVYPKSDILRYCALNGVKKELDGVWTVIDREIGDPDVDDRSEFMRIFEKYASPGTPEKAADSRWRDIGEDTCNIAIFENDDGSVSYDRRDRAVDLMGYMYDRSYDNPYFEHARKLMNSSIFDIYCVPPADELRELVRDYCNGIVRAVRFIDANAEQIAENILEEVFCDEMDRCSEENRSTVFGLLRRYTPSGVSAVHPLAARYNLYRLADILRCESDMKNIIELRDKVLGISDTTSCGKYSEDPIERVYSMGFAGNLKSERREFCDWLKEHCRFKEYELKMYTEERVWKYLCPAMQKRLGILIDGIDSFFGSIGEASKKLDGMIEGNIRKNEGSRNNTVWVNGSRRCKEAILGAVGDCVSDVDMNAVNRTVLDRLYGSMCAAIRLRGKGNIPYIGVRAEDGFIGELTKTYSDAIMRCRRDVIDVDIVDAMCREQELVSKKRDVDEYEYLDEYVDEHQPVRGDIGPYTDAVRRMASPMLMYRFVPEMSFMIDGGWHYNGCLAEKHLELCDESYRNSATVGEAYSPYEIYCFNRADGIKLGDVPAFDETSPMRKSYSDVVKVFRGLSGAMYPTPHLDCTWHELFAGKSSEE